MRIITMIMVSNGVACRHFVDAAYLPGTASSATAIGRRHAGTIDWTERQSGYGTLQRARRVGPGRPFVDWLKELGR
jgi:hypothetical protein